MARAGRALAPGRAFAFVAFHTDQWRETGRASRFAYDEERARRVLSEAAFVVEHTEVEREVRTFGSVAPPSHGAAFERWLDGGNAGSMDYLERTRGDRLDPSRLLPGARAAVA